jgi:UDP-hydrolysing UDP-N-acetyl-D-glucosamine 2-epimerase
MTRRKVCVVVTARATYARIKTALEAIRDHPGLDLQLVVAASALLDRYGNAIQVIEDDGFEVAARAMMVLEGENPIAMAKTAGIGVLELATVFENLRPDVVVTVADRFETIATALAATYMNIPLVHVQGGEVSGSIDEKVRHAVTKLADFHFVSTSLAAERVMKMGEDPASVFVTGCPSIDLAAQIANEPELGFDPFARYGGVGDLPQLADGYIVVLHHPVTTEYALARTHVFEVLHAVKDADLPALWFWPNVDAGSDGTSNGIRTFRETEDCNRFHFFKNMAPLDFLRLLHSSRCIVGNSSVGIRESAFLGIPAVNIGTRQTGRERGSNVLDVDYDRDQIVKAIRHHLGNGRFDSEPLYGDGATGPRIAEILTDIPLRIEKRLTY